MLQPTGSMTTERGDRLYCKHKVHPKSTTVYVPAKDLGPPTRLRVREWGVPIPTTGEKA
jgi:hypothetical protein